MANNFTCFILVAGLFISFAQAAEKQHDPYENFNRHAYAMNKTLDTVILKPATVIYRGVIPGPAQTGVRNAFSNLAEMPSFANNVLQGNVQHATVTFFRFAINSTFGLLGLFDVASHMGLKKHKEDFGLTLARWGDKDSPFVVVPFFGPSTMRDALGMPVDLFAFSLYPHIKSVKLRNGLLTARIINKRASFLELEGFVTQVALDRYAFERDAYLQYRRKMVMHNEGLVEPDSATADSVNDPFEAEG